MLQTNEEYYENQDNFGKYQYVPLSEVIKKMDAQANDSRTNLYGTNRSTIIMFAKEGVRELNKNVDQEKQAYEITVPDTLVWPLPQDYVSKLKIDLVIRDQNTGNFETVGLNHNKGMHVSMGLLQDDQWDLLYDDEGYTLEADSTNAVNQAYKANINYPGSPLGNNPTKDTSKFSTYGDYELVERRGIIVFSSELANKEVVIKYVSDGLQNELWNREVSIHKYTRAALEDYIYYHCIERLNNKIVSANEKERARRKWESSRHKSVMALADFDMASIVKKMNQATKLF